MKAQIAMGFNAVSVIQEPGADDCFFWVPTTVFKTAEVDYTPSDIGPSWFVKREAHTDTVDHSPYCLAPDGVLFTEEYIAGRVRATDAESAIAQFNSLITASYRVLGCE
jgi:hypothetical protein